MEVACNNQQEPVNLPCSRNRGYSKLWCSGCSEGSSPDLFSALPWYSTQTKIECQCCWFKLSLVNLVLCHEQVSSPYTQRADA